MSDLIDDIVKVNTARISRAKPLGTPKNELSMNYKIYRLEYCPHCYSRSGVRGLTDGEKLFLKTLDEQAYRSEKAARYNFYCESCSSLFEKPKRLEPKGHQVSETRRISQCAMDDLSDTFDDIRLLRVYNSLGVREKKAFDYIYSEDLKPAYFARCERDLIKEIVSLYAESCRQTKTADIFNIVEIAFNVLQSRRLNAKKYTLSQMANSIGVSTSELSPGRKWNSILISLERCFDKIENEVNTQLFGA